MTPMSNVLSRPRRMRAPIGTHFFWCSTEFVVDHAGPPGITHPAQARR